MQPIPESSFEALVVDAIDGLPDEVLDLLDNVAILIDDEHPEDLLGLYRGVPRTERDDYGFMELPDTVTLYRLALCDMCADLDELRHEVRVTVVHELAHHLGIDDDRLDELGWA
ncbi:MAG: metallopeptidase family protein [Acidimicrobiales bacterium]